MVIERMWLGIYAHTRTFHVNIAYVSLINMHRYSRKNEIIFMLWIHILHMLWIGEH